MQRVAVIGLGRMGRALAEAMLTRGVPVIAWNRTPGRNDRLERLGATIAATVVEAVRDAALTIVCLTDHAACLPLLTDSRVAGALAGKDLLQVSTVTPEQSRELARWAGSNQTRYLDGAILGIPQRVTDGNCIVVYSGSRQLFEAHREILTTLGGHPRFVAEQAGAAPALETAVFSCTYGLWLGYFHGAAICHAMGLPIDCYVDTIADSLPTRIPTARRFAERIAGRRYDNPAAALELHAAAYRHVVDLSGAVGIDTALPDFLYRYFERAMATGHGQDELSSLFELMILRQPIVSAPR